jgi:hypothetical protein
MLLMICAPGVGAAALVPLGATLIDSARAKAAERVNAPDILIADPTSLRFPDPLHITLPDGRTFRVAHVVAPDPGSQLHGKSVETLWRPLMFGGNRLRGLKTVGTSPDGETLAEMWGFQPSLGGCGSTTWSERRAARIPHWKDLTWQLLASGYYRLEPGVTDRELLSWERAARREALGVWNDPAVLRQAFDLEQLERTVAHEASYGGPTARERRVEAAELLLRAAPQPCAPTLLSVVKNPREKDVFVRIRLAQLLEKSGRVEGTAYLVNGLRSNEPTGLDEYQLNSVVSEYQSFWQLPYFLPSDRATLVAHFDQKMQAARGR